MALRMGVYVLRLYQDLLRTGQVTRQSKLPPVPPLVLYNGDGRWTAVQDIAELIETAPSGLGHYRLQMRY